MSAESNLQVVSQTYTFFGAGNMEGVISGFSPDITWESKYTPEVPLNGTWTGSENVLKFFGLLDELLAVKTFVPEKFVSQDDTVVVLGYEEVQVKSNGAEYRNDWVQVWTIKNEKVVHLKSYNDTAAVAAAFKGS
ncbi:MAG: nuclear transport factor 2 family protein [Tildeniella torsiva UHER 1998/13D]|jgi:ketosteroid isomerase-like protein|nr:nuclear transport factor 2 family protein [Tildeniella torsiva UHER 1998/13D]